MKREGNGTPESRVLRRNRIRAVLFLLLAGITGLVGLLVFGQYLNRIKKEFAGAAVDTKPVVVAAMDIPIAMRLIKKHLNIVKWPVDSIPEGSFGKIEDLVGRTVRQAIIKDEPILKRKLADTKQGHGMAALLDNGTRAMAVEVDSVVGVAGFVQPGDFVDVITTMNPDEETKKVLKNDARSISKIILQNIKVLAVGDQLSTKGHEPVKVKVVTLAVTCEESERLALGSKYGKILLTIRPRTDLEIAETEGVSPLTLLAPEGASKVVRVEPEKTRKHSRPTRKPLRIVPTPPPAPSSSTVEIIRGTSVEQRKLQ